MSVIVLVLGGARAFAGGGLDAVTLEEERDVVEGWLEVVAQREGAPPQSPFSGGMRLVGLSALAPVWETSGVGYRALGFGGRAAWEVSPPLVLEVGLDGAWEMNGQEEGEWNLLVPSAGARLRVLAFGPVALEVPLSAEAARWLQREDTQQRVVGLGGSAGLGLAWDMGAGRASLGARYHGWRALVDVLEDEPVALESLASTDLNVGAIGLEFGLSRRAEGRAALPEPRAWSSEMPLPEDMELRSACGEEAWTLEVGALHHVCRLESGGWVGVGGNSGEDFLVFAPMLEAVASLWLHFDDAGISAEVLQSGLIPVTGGLRDAWTMTTSGGQALTIEGLTQRTVAGEVFVSRYPYEVGTARYRVVGVSGSLVDGQSSTFLLREL